ncbi:MAG TPA: hypothetical protein VGE83_11240 [Terracidiphilus sp.]
MKRLGFALMLFVAMSSPAWAAKKITVQELKETLISFLETKKSDQEVGSRLQVIELSEELTVSTMNSLMKYLPGPLSTQQIYVLEARSADLVPPAADLPATPAPDAAAQKAMLAKVETYVTRTYEQLPALKAIKITLRFQDNMEAVANSSGVVGSATEVDTTAGFSNPASFVHFINSAVAPVVSEHGAEKLAWEKDKTPWGANKMIALEEPDPSLGAVFHEARAAGSIQWLRWELVNGKQAAVYSFAVAKTKSRLAVNVCCFPNVKQAGVATFYTGTTAAALAGSEAAGGGSGGVTGNFQTSTDWHNYKSSVPYHGELFIDPDTGTVVRMITEAELKPSEVVHQVDTRIDYGPVNVGAKVLMAPVKTVVNTEVVPKGDSGAGGYSTRKTLFLSEYKSYQLDGAR